MNLSKVRSIAGKKGGINRVAAMTPEERSISARNAARARWDAMTPEERSEWQRKRWKKTRRAE